MNGEAGGGYVGKEVLMLLDLLFQKPYADIVAYSGSLMIYLVLPEFFLAYTVFEFVCPR